MIIILNKHCWQLGNVWLYPEGRMEDGDHSIHNRLAGPWTHGCEQKLALFGTFSQNFDFATIQKKKKKPSLCFHAHLNLSHGCEVLILFCWQPS